LQKDELINQIRTKKRVADHGEVFTAEREVNAMLDLVKNETDRIESRFLEPACGSGNFLVEVLKRKLDQVVYRYKKSHNEFLRYSIVAVSSIYGVDILEDNVKECRKNLYEIYILYYKTVFKCSPNDKVAKVISYILSKNIVHGDALSMMTVGNNSKPIVFAEWSSVNSIKIKRRDYTLAELLANAPFEEKNLFSDLFEEVFIPKPIKEYPSKHFLNIGDYNDE